MDSTLNFLAFDLGASNGRAIIGKYNGRLLELEEIHKFSNRGYTLNGGLYWNILGLFSEVKTGLQKAGNLCPGGLAGVAVDTWGVDYGLLDQSDNLLTNPYHYRDSRTDNLMEEVLAKIPASGIYEKTGIQFMQINTLFQLYADLKYRPWILDNAESLLFMPDLFNFFLTGEKYNECTIASTSQMIKPRNRQWAHEILKDLQIPSTLPGEIILPGRELGTIRENIRRECGLDGKVPVMVAGSHDTASAVAGTPLEDTTKSVYLSSGTWSLLGMELDSPVINPDSLSGNFTNECGIKNKIRFLKNITGLWLIQECKRIWNKEGKDLSYADITGAAYRSPADKFRIDPNDERFLNPRNMVTEIKDYCRETGQPLPENYAQMARGIYESLAYSYREVIKGLEELVDTDIETINMVGGGIKAEILCRFTADITERKVVAGPVEATALGNILGQLMAAGEISSLVEGREIVRNSVSLKEYYPE